MITASNEEATHPNMLNSSVDVEEKQGPKEHLEGFADFSHYIASDDALSIYRRFGSLGARNLLYLQAELQALEQELEILDDDDIKFMGQGEDSDEKELVNAAARAWESFVQQADDGNERQKRKMKLMMRIRAVMKEYGVLSKLNRNIKLINIQRMPLYVEAKSSPSVLQITMI
jgi:hypothetical protein